MVKICVATHTWLLCLPGYLDADSTGEHLPCETRQYAVAVKKSTQMIDHLSRKIFKSSYFITGHLECGVLGMVAITM